MSDISSMTGYANVKVMTELGEINIDLRSVNSRFLDFTFRCSEELRQFEPKIRELINARLARGKIECRCYLVEGSDAARTQLNEAAFENLLHLQDEVLKRNPKAKSLTVSSILGFPGIVGAPVTDETIFRETVLEQFDRCLEDLCESRRREGEALKRVLLKYCDEIETLVKALRPKIPLILENMQNKLTERLEEALSQKLAENTNITKEEITDRIRQEVTLYGIKIDVNEEMERLLTHVKEVRRTLEKGGNAGKRLDFMMQELNREANTLGSKAASIDMTQTSVNLKLVIESMREQIQNIE